MKPIKTKAKFLKQVKQQSKNNLERRLAECYLTSRHQTPIN